jgi:recombinational DNA repair protein RecR
MARFNRLVMQRQEIEGLRIALAQRIEAALRARTCANCEHLQEDQGSYSCNNEDVAEVDALADPATFGCIYFDAGERP